MVIRNQSFRICTNLYITSIFLGTQFPFSDFFQILQCLSAALKGKLDFNPLIKSDSYFPILEKGSQTKQKLLIFLIVLNKFESF